MTGIATEQDVFEVVRRNTLEVLPEVRADLVRIDGTLTDLGANSIDRADIVTMSMEALGITVPIREFQAVRDIQSLVDLLRRHL
ncbi:MAG TPA: phosphopantetheine-binding protein [Actinocrinis sp.]|nr:phosphopantetheine-binding protein [Actinocrinis sp.]